MERHYRCAKCKNEIWGNRSTIRKCPECGNPWENESDDENWEVEYECPKCNNRFFIRMEPYWAYRVKCPFCSHGHPLEVRREVED